MNVLKIIKQTSLALILFVSISGCSKTVKPEEVMNINMMALGGYDPVAYFNDAKATHGGMVFSYAYKDLQWYFSSKKNLKDFKAEPQAYIPQFGGFCSYALANEQLVLSDPSVWYMHNQKLYLFENIKAKNRWFKQMDTFIQMSTKQYDLILNPVKEAEEPSDD